MTPNPLKMELVDTQDSIEILDIQDEEYRAHLRMLMSITYGSIANKHTKRAYSRHLLAFYKARLPLTKLGVTQYLSTIKIGPSYSLALSALRRLSVNAESDHFISPFDGADIRRIHHPKLSPRMGRWLSLDGAKLLIGVLPTVTLRDAALISLLLGCGLRSAEAATVQWSSYRTVDGRAALVDLIGKGGKLRTVPVPEWAATWLDRWQAFLVDQIGFKEVALDGPILRSHYRGSRHGLTPGGVYYALAPYSRALELPFTAHDLRRTLARLMRRAGVPVEQIQYTLGHSNMTTTEIYLGGALEMAPGKAGVDRIAW